ncbi:response regulator [Mesorhizobium sp. ANAO-SY3R2]|uniref:response regulator n=1 Tax=Mesorhizobium sp. ANAO-SY3R2 TaxID=3166644 RepID=UPI00366C45D8
MKRCLFVDDSSVIRKVAKRILNSADLVVIEASTGAEGLDMCAYDMPEIIVVDGSLEDMNVVDFIRRVRAMPAHVKPQIAICLTEVDIGAIMRAKRAGAQGYLLKPFTRPQLLERFRAFDIAA